MNKQNKKGEGTNILSAYSTTWIGSTKKTNDVTNETMLQPSKEPLETIREPTQKINNAPK